jgi:uncharacterized protein YaaR (DUF327 family)
MEIRTRPKKVFGSDETFEIYDFYYDRDERGFIVETLENKAVKEYLKRRCHNVSWENKAIIVLKIFEKGYGEFDLWFMKLDDKHLVVEYEYPCEYGHTDYFVFRGKLYCIHHCLTDDLVDDYPYITDNLTEIIRKDALPEYLKLLDKELRHLGSKPEWVKVDFYKREDELIEIIEYFYPDADVFKILDEVERLYTNEWLFGKEWNIYDLIKFLLATKRIYRSMIRGKTVYMHKSIPLFTEASGLNSQKLKKIMRDIMATEKLEPLSREEIRQLMKNYKGRVRVFLTSNLDAELMEFFKNSPKSLQYALFKLLSEKLEDLNKKLEEV